MLDSTNFGKKSSTIDYIERKLGIFGRDFQALGAPVGTVPGVLSALTPSLKAHPLIHGVSGSQMQQYPRDL